MALAFAAGNGNSTFTPNTTTTFTLSVVGSNPLVVLSLIAYATGVVTTASGAPTSVTFGGTAMTAAEVVGFSSGSSKSYYSSIWYLAAPPSGTSTVSVTMAGQSGFTVGTVMSAACFTGALQVAPLHSNTFATDMSGSANPQGTLVTLPGTKLIVGALSSTDVANSVANSNSMWPTNNYGGAYQFSPGLGGGQTVAWTDSNTEMWAIALAAFNPVGSTPPGGFCEASSFIGI